MLNILKLLFSKLQQDSPRPDPFIASVICYSCNKNILVTEAIPIRTVFLTEKGFLCKECYAINKNKQK